MKNKVLALGLCIWGLTMVLNHTIGLPDMLLGIGFGVGVSLELIGLFLTGVDFSKQRQRKINFIKKLLVR